MNTRGFLNFSFWHIKRKERGGGRRINDRINRLRIKEIYQIMKLGDNRLQDGKGNI